MLQYMLINKNTLQHHGILGMHWGIRRFQPYPKGYKGNGKEVGAAKRANQRELRKKLKQQKKEEKKRQSQPKKLTDKEKEQLIQSANKTEIKKYQNQLSMNQLQQAVNRINLNQSLTKNKFEREQKMRTYMTSLTAIEKTLRFPIAVLAGYRTIKEFNKIIGK